MGAISKYGSGAFAIFLASLVWTGADAQDKPIACGLNQFTAAERVEAGHQLVSAVEAEMEPPTELTQKIKEKLDQCSSPLNGYQRGLATDYTESAMLLDYIGVTLTSSRGQPVMDLYWDQMPADLRRLLLEGAYEQNEEKRRAEEHTITDLSKPYLMQFIPANGLGSEAAFLLFAGEIAKASMISGEAIWVV